MSNADIPTLLRKPQYYLRNNQRKRNTSAGIPRGRTDQRADSEHHELDNQGSHAQRKAPRW